jgi:hypothetical protein
MKIFITALSMDERKEGFSILIREMVMSSNWLEWTVYTVNGQGT